jgi:sec-independent protein translocase protein TatA
MDFLGIGPGELVLILVVILIIWGPGKIPEMAKQLGKTMRAIRKVSEDFTANVTKEIEETKSIVAPAADKDIQSSQTEAPPPEMVSHHKPPSAENLEGRQN